MISVVPGDVGKPTARLEKGIIREGGCRWEYPVYETVKFTEDARTGKINEKTYHFIVSTVRNFINVVEFCCFKYNRVIHWVIESFGFV